MRSKATRPGRAWAARWGRRRGDGAILSAIVSAGAVVVLTIAGVVIWTEAAAGREVGRITSENNVRHAGAAARAIESMLDANEVSRMRGFVSEIGATPGVASARVELPDGRVIADADPGAIQAVRLPETWEGAAPGDAESPATEGGVLTVIRAISAPGRGEAAVRLEYVPAPLAVLTAETRAAALACAAGGIAMIIVVGVRVRARVGAALSIRGALRAMHAGETADAALLIDPAGGPEAQAWNTLIESRSGSGDVASSGSTGANAGAAGAMDALGVCDLLVQGVMVIDEQLRVTHANGAAAILLQRTPDRTVGRPLSELIDDSGVVEAARSAAAARARGRKTIEVSAGDDDPEGVGETLRFTVRGIRDRDDAAALVVIEDVTQQKLAERSRRAFVAQATHELRTPLTNVRLYVEQALEEGDDDPQIRAKALNVINQETRRLERIVGDMLSVSEIEAGALKLRISDVRLDQFFDELRADYEAGALEKGIAMRFDLSPKLGVIRGDRDKLALALHNLVGNAIKYTPEGGTVSIKAEPGDDGALTVTVTDSGMGITPGEQEKVFERFFRSADPRVAGITGSGIGLSLARDVVRLHGGDITVDSDIDKGSTFTLTVPGREQGALAA